MKHIIANASAAQTSSDIAITALGLAAGFKNKQTGNLSNPITSGTISNQINELMLVKRIFLQNKINCKDMNEIRTFASISNR